MRRTGAGVIVVVFLILFSWVPVWGSETEARLVFSHVNSYDAEAYVLEKLLANLDLEGPLGQELVYSQTASGTFTNEDIGMGTETLYTYSGRLSMAGAFREMTDTQGPVVRFVGTLDGEVEFRWSLSGDEVVNRKSFEQMPFTTWQQGDDQLLVVGYDGLGVDISDRVPYRVWQRVVYASGRVEEETLYYTDGAGFALMRFTLESGVLAPAPERGAVVVETRAEEEPGESSVSVPLGIVAGLGLAALGAGALAMARGGKNKKDQEDEKAYKLVVTKDFGNRLKVNGEAEFVYAMMVEVNQEGVEFQRPDLTRQIEIFSGDRCMEVGPNTMAGDYMAASIRVSSERQDSLPEEGTVSFRFTGEGGTFQNNMVFQVMGEPYVRLPEPNLSILAGSGETFSFPFQVINFTSEPVVEAKAMGQHPPFVLEVEAAGEGDGVIRVTDQWQGDSPEGFYEPFTCEIIAQNEKEHTRTVFSVVLCHEGLRPDLMGHRPEIKAYREKDEDSFEELPVIFRLGLWNRERNRLEMVKPENLKLAFEDSEQIINTLGIDDYPDPDYRQEEGVRVLFEAKKALPAENPVTGMLKSSCKSQGKTHEHELEIRLLPDMLDDPATFEEEVQNVLRIIHTYMPEDRFREKKLQELQAGLDKFGVEDLRLFRRDVWQIAMRCILQEKDDYLRESYWYDEAIATLDLVKHVGDTAFTLALTPFGGPMTAFVLTNVKDGVIDMAEIYFSSSSIGFSQMMTLIEKRMVDLAGQADVLVKPPGRDEPRKLAAWLAGFLMYRIVYHWYFTKDEDNNPLGLLESVKEGLMDLAGQGAAILIEDFVKASAKNDGNLFWEGKYSRTMSETVGEEAGNLGREMNQLNEAMERGMDNAYDWLSDKNNPVMTAIDRAAENIAWYLRALLGDGRL